MKTLIFQNSNENIVRISALKVFIASLGLPYLSQYLLSPQEAPRKLQKISGQKSLQYFRCYFGNLMPSSIHSEFNWPLKRSNVIIPNYKLYSTKSGIHESKVHYRRLCASILSNSNLFCCSPHYFTNLKFKILNLELFWFT